MSAMIPLCGKKRKLFYLTSGNRVPSIGLYAPLMDVRAVLRVNLRALMVAAADGRRSGPPGVLELDAESGVDKNTIYRAIDSAEPYSIGIDKLEKIAKTYNLPAWALLVPELDPVSTPESRTPEQHEARAQALAETLVQEALDERRRLREKSPRRRGAEPATAGQTAQEKPRRFTDRAKK